MRSASLCTGDTVTRTRATHNLDHPGDASCDIARRLPGPGVEEFRRCAIRASLMAQQYRQVSMRDDIGGDPPRSISRKAAWAWAPMINRSRPSSRTRLSNSSPNGSAPIARTCRIACTSCSISTGGTCGVGAPARTPASRCTSCAPLSRRRADMSALTVRASSRQAMATRRPNEAGAPMAGTIKTGRSVPNSAARKARRVALSAGGPGWAATMKSARLPAPPPPWRGPCAVAARHHAPWRGQASAAA